MMRARYWALAGALLAIAGGSLLWWGYCVDLRREKERRALLQGPFSRAIVSAGNLPLLRQQLRSFQTEFEHAHRLGLDSDVGIEVVSDCQLIPRMAASQDSVETRVQLMRMGATIQNALPAPDRTAGKGGLLLGFLGICFLGKSVVRGWRRDR